MVSVDKKGIDKIAFPSVSICHPLSWTWPSITSYLHSIDPDGTSASQAMSADIMSTYLQRKQCETLQNCPPTGWQYYDIFMTKSWGGMLNDVDGLTELSKPLRQLVEEVAKKNQLNILALWRVLNKPLLMKYYEKYWPETDLAKEESEVKEALSKLSEDDRNKIYQTLLSPKIHGNFKEEYVLVPFCSFGSKVLKKCELFERQENYYRKDEVCYTFNKDGNYSGESLEKLKGLNFVVNFRLPLELGTLEILEPPKPNLIVHPFNEIPDASHFPATSREIHAVDTASTPKVGPLVVGVEASITNITDNFADMGESKRNCYLNIGKEANYSRNNCRMIKALELAKSTCNCSPWFLKKDNSAVCDPNGLSCFDNFTENYRKSNIEGDCLQECVSTEYDLTFGEISKLNDLKNSYGEEWKNFFSKDNPISYTLETTEDPKYGMVHVNFIRKEATVIMKDAKVTFADMLGNIGGTLGVFVGLSFVGLLDFFIWLWDWVREKWSVRTRHVK